ncbi:MAG: murein biosynthesis integral membrane protein MurJ [Candidatus Nealsonbacteria bacterium CG02_land_8_20_14_3_00_40_11]|uniref:Probable lipid II flippase MurJ n=1 Tax=Candidatus Nealsonbacteria bacterium CG02_land_8_20_14_3_00_40_11 TaxID=1974700 RepID=A0A2M7D860_9BACT|nr:MAG: murein biosynthesis integral membrane protein MurJ [Candidatus Nealsonbacteria bacterium CG02_land_8_20_14_3_00_40_11]
MFGRFFNSQTKTISGAAGILAITALISRLLGLVRDRLLASTFGAGSDLDVYFAAFRIPDFVYNILIAGGVIVAFLPLFSEYFLKDKKEAWDFANNVLNVFLFFLVLISLGISIFAPILVKIITPGFNPQQISLTSLLTRILFLSPILLGLSSIFSGVLQYFNKFLAYSLAPVLYNLGIIMGIIFLAPASGILGVTLGVILGAFLHMVIQIPSAINSGFWYKPTFNLKDPKIKKVFSLMIPRTLGVAAPQINLMVVTAIASGLPAGAISIFTFANNLQQFPLGLIGIPFAIAAFPALSQDWAAQRKDEFIKKFSLTFRKILFLIIPISFLIFILKNQIVEIILRTGRFSEDAAKIAAASLGLFVLGIFATCLIPLIFRAFFALQDTKTPTIIAIIAMILNIFLSFGFVRLLSFPNSFQASISNLFNLQGVGNIAVIGLPLAFSIDSILQFILLMVFLFRKINIKK